MALNPTRLRRPSKRFGWIDRRVLSEGHLERLDYASIATYFTLCLVADRYGISFYRPETLARIIKRPTIAVVEALVELTRHQLIARDGHYVQVNDLDEIVKSATPAALSTTAPCPPVPPPGSKAPEETAETILARLATAERERLLRKARERFERFLGKHEPSSGALAATAAAILHEEQALSRRTL